MKVTKPEFPAVSPLDPAVKKTAPVRPTERVSTAQSERVASTINQVRAQLPADRAARVREIAQAVKKGEYQPDPQQIAERIVDDAELAARLQAMLDR